MAASFWVVGVVASFWVVAPEAVKQVVEAVKQVVEAVEKTAAPTWVVGTTEAERVVVTMEEVTAPAWMVGPAPARVVAREQAEREVVPPSFRYHWTMLPGKEWSLVQM